MLVKKKGKWVVVGTKIHSPCVYTKRDIQRQRIEAERRNEILQKNPKARFRRFKSVLELSAERN